MIRTRQTRILRGPLLYFYCIYNLKTCHAKVHESIARIDDDASPDPEAVAERERRRETERSASAFETASEAYDGEE